MEGENDKMTYDERCIKTCYRDNRYMDVGPRYWGRRPFSLVFQDARVIVVIFDKNQ